MAQKIAFLLKWPDWRSCSTPPRSPPDCSYHGLFCRMNTSWHLHVLHIKKLMKTEFSSEKKKRELMIHKNWVCLFFLKILAYYILYFSLLDSLKLGTKDYKHIFKPLIHVTLDGMMCTWFPMAHYLIGNVSLRCIRFTYTMAKAKCHHNCTHYNMAVTTSRLRGQHFFAYQGDILKE